MVNSHDVNLIINALCNNQTKVTEEGQDYLETNFSEIHPKMRKSEENGRKGVRKKMEEHWTMDIKSELEAIRKLPLCCN